MKNPTHITDLLNQRFGMLQVIEIMPWEFKGRSKRYYVKCKCDCGSISNVETNYLRSGNKKHCGCIPQDRTNVRNANKSKERVSILSKGLEL